MMHSTSLEQVLENLFSTSSSVFILAFSSSFWFVHWEIGPRDRNGHIPSQCSFSACATSSRRGVLALLSILPFLTMSMDGKISQSNFFWPCRHLLTLTLLRQFRLFMENQTFQQIVIAFAATYGLYLISSFMHFEPWHMFTSFAQYMFLLPSYVNILMMYAMCNLHDVTWGTKGDNGAAKDLGGAKKVKGEDGKEFMEVEILTAREDVDQLWTASRAALRMPAPEEKQRRDAATKQADHDRNSRTNVVLAWVGTNMCVQCLLPWIFTLPKMETNTMLHRLMIMVFTSTAFNQWAASHVNKDRTSAFNPYLTVLFYALYVFFSFQIMCQGFLKSTFPALDYLLFASSVPHYTLYSDYSVNDRSLPTRFQFDFFVRLSILYFYSYSCVPCELILQVVPFKRHFYYNLNFPSNISSDFSIERFVCS